MLDRSRPLDQPRIDPAEPRRLIDGGELLGRCIPVGRLDRRHVSADHKLFVERLAEVREIALAAHLARKTRAGLQRAKDRACRLRLLENPMQGRIRERCVELGEELHVLGRKQKRIDALRPRRSDHLG